MSDLIERGDAIKALYKYSFVSKDIIEREINAIPSADLHSEFSEWARHWFKDSADRPRGEWRNLDGEPVPLDEGGCPTESAWCSECGTWLVASDEYSAIGRFCPNCGAKMKGADDDIDNV